MNDKKEATCVSPFAARIQPSQVTITFSSCITRIKYQVKSIINSFLFRMSTMHNEKWKADKDIYEDLPDPGTLNADQDNEYVVCLRKLDAHFRTEENVPFECHVFRQLTPTKGEPLTSSSL